MYNNVILSRTYDACMHKWTVWTGPLVMKWGLVAYFIDWDINDLGHVSSDHKKLVKMADEISWNLVALLVFGVAHCHIEGILPKGPYPPCLHMADRALSTGYPRYCSCCPRCTQTSSHRCWSWARWTWTWNSPGSTTSTPLQTRWVIKGRVAFTDTTILVPHFNIGCS